jgi:hypothetical protein
MSGTLRVQGVVVVDSSGAERILIGAPIPAASSRVRTDSARASQVWGPSFPPEYDSLYAGYRHDMNGILVLDERGFDRVALGHNVPDPNIGRRIGPSTGMIINDSLGFERSGYGLLTVDGKDRVTLGLDRDGGESIGLRVDDDGWAGLFAREGAHLTYLGAGQGRDLGLQSDAPFFGLLIRDGDSIQHLLGPDPVR